LGDVLNQHKAESDSWVCVLFSWWGFGVIVRHTPVKVVFLGS
jgi:hypothetical protein